MLLFWFCSPCCFEFIERSRVAPGFWVSLELRRQNRYIWDLAGGHKYWNSECLRLRQLEVFIVCSKYLPTFRNTRTQEQTYLALMHQISLWSCKYKHEVTVVALWFFFIKVSRLDLHESFALLKRHFFHWVRNTISWLQNHLVLSVEELVTCNPSFVPNLDPAYFTFYWDRYSNRDFSIAKDLTHISIRSLKCVAEFCPAWSAVLQNGSDWVVEIGLCRMRISSSCTFTCRRYLNFPEIGFFYAK